MNKDVWPKRVDFYVHKSKDSMYETALDEGIFEQGDPALEEFVYQLYETRLTLEVQKSGKAKIIAVAGKELVDG